MMNTLRPVNKRHEMINESLVHSIPPSHLIVKLFLKIIEYDYSKNRDKENNGVIFSNI